MFPVFLLAAAVGVIAVALLFLFWRQMDRRVQLAFSDQNIDDLAERLEQALEQQQHLTSRIEHLEAIVASEPWETTKNLPTPPLTLPGAQTDPSSEEPEPDRRQKNR